MNLKDLCSKINMPEEVTKIVLDYECSFDYEKAAPAMDKLFHKETWKQGEAELKELIGEDKDGFGILACELICALKTFEVYKEHEISEQIYVDTMKCFSRFVGEHMESYGCYGFDREWWTPRQLSGLLYRIGELEYEMTAEEDGKRVYLHIPSDARLTREEIEKSLKLAKQFFEEKFSEYASADILCESWLLSPTLKETLSSGSHILEFQKYFEIKSSETEECEFMTWVFKRPDLPLADLPENTSLQRKLKAYLLAGGKVAAAVGKLRKELWFPR
ncbi:MAG: acyltransferase domain-containing protein [Clostridium sp.]|nr:acyltransferase domain-containing protein [Clostridium sp.]